MDGVSDLVAQLSGKYELISETIVGEDQECFVHIEFLYGSLRACFDSDV
jgi:hypothetical protein